MPTVHRQLFCCHQDEGRQQLPDSSWLPCCWHCPPPQKDRCFLARVSSLGMDRHRIYALGGDEPTWTRSCWPRVSPTPHSHSYRPLPSLTAVVFRKGEHGVLSSWKGVWVLICTLWELDHTLLQWGIFSFDGEPCEREWLIRCLRCDLSLLLCTPTDSRTAFSAMCTWGRQRHQTCQCLIRSRK